MHMTVNGEEREVATGTTVAGLITLLEITDTRVAVEVNKHLVRRAQHAEHVLADGDVVEVVTLVGGG